MSAGIEFTFTLTEAEDAIIRCVRAGKVLFQQSSPGIGKSSIARQVAEKFGLKYIDLRLSQCTPEDLMGLPFKSDDGKRAEFLPFNMFPTVDTIPPEGFLGWMLHLDEFNSAHKSVEAASYKLVLDREVGQHRLADNVAIVCSGNKEDDGAITHRLSTAMQSRLIHIEVVVSHREFIAYAYRRGLDQRIISFLEFAPDKLHVFDPDHEDKTFACPRTWEFASDLIKGEEKLEPLQKLLGGTISKGIAIEFVAFSREFEKLPKLSEILDNPNLALVPVERSAKFATISFLIGNATKDNIKPLLTYVKRFNQEEQILFYRSIIRKDRKFRDIPELAAQLGAVARFLDED